MSKFHLYCLLLILFIAALQGCGGIPGDALRMNRMTLEEKRLQTRVFDTADEKKILSASDRVLQGLGFNLDESKTDLGLIVGSQDPDAIKAGHVILTAVVAGLNNLPAAYSQKIRISVVTSPTGDDMKRTSVRVTFQRIVWDDYGRITRLERLDNPELYEGFFKKLDTALFPEAHAGGRTRSRSQVKSSSITSRIFETADNVKTLRAVMATLQDLGFLINKADEVSGSVSATKFDHHTMRITVGIRSHGETQMHVRANAQYNLKAIEDPDFYQQFFTTLEKAMFSAAHNRE